MKQEVTRTSLVLILCCLGVHSASLSVSGSTSIAVAGETDIIIKCTFTLDVNESASSLTLEKTDPSGNFVSWDIASGNTPIVTNSWTLDTSDPASGLTARLPRTQVTKTSGGNYICSLSSNPGSATTKESQAVTIHYAPKVTISPTENPVPVNIGGTLQLTCNVDAVPVAQITWTFPPEKNSLQGNTLTIKDIKKTQAGSYTCTATNKVTPSPGVSGDRSDKATATVQVRYLDEPKFAVSSTEVREFESVTFACSATGVPAPTVLLSHPDGSDLTANKPSPTTHQMSMGCRDAGIYTCRAEIVQIDAFLKVTQRVKVLCKPRKDDSVAVVTTSVRNVSESAIFKGVVIAYPQPSFVWERLVPGTLDEWKAISDMTGHYEIINNNLETNLNVTVLSADDFTDYRLRVANDQGETTLNYSIQGKTSPFKVETLAMANVSANSITVRWESSYNGGQEQVYIVQYRQVGGDNDGHWREIITNFADPGRTRHAQATISGIQSGSQYRIRVYSTSLLGRSQFSNDITVSTSDLPSAISFGVGIAIGLVIAFVVLAVAGGVYFVWRRRRLSNADASGNRTEEVNYGNNAFNPGTPSAQSYASLDGLREKPSNYDSLDNTQPLYQNVAVQKQDEVSSPELYMNYSPPQPEELYANS